MSVRDSARPGVTSSVGVAGGSSDGGSPAGGDAPRARSGRRRRRTETQCELLRYIGGETALNGGVCCTKRELAELTGRSVKTIDRSLSALRNEGVIEVEMRFDKNGAQLPSRYRSVFGRDE